ncbi:MAG TPA: hypothetical protein VI583_05035 [Cyclobacteriaceae bacterium]|nr:hypothetical protein [Cyclobacteriaceae bacterium]
MDHTMKFGINRYLLTVILFILVSLIESCDPLLADDTVVDGKVMFWSSFDGPPIDVYIDGNYKGTVSQFFSEEPQCESQGCVTATLTPGTYTFYAEEQFGPGGNDRTWEYDVIVKASMCGTYELTSSGSRVSPGLHDLSASGDH